MATRNNMLRQPFYHTDQGGMVHACDGAEVAPGEVLLWTKCGLDLPAKGGFRSTEPVTVTCPRCIEAIGKAPFDDRFERT